MAQNHGARQQKRGAKQKAKRSAKRSKSFNRTSKDPTIRLEQAEKWPVVQAYVSSQLWNSGMGYLAIARRESEREIIFASFMLDVYCLGVKDAFWRAGTLHDFEDLIQKMNKMQDMRAIAPACLVKIIKGAVAYAQSLGLEPHPDYRHASMLLAGIDPSTCPDQLTFGRNGKPFYIQGPFESPAKAEAIMKSVQAAGGHFIAEVSGAGSLDLSDMEDEFDEDESREDDDDDEQL